jgi:hypothetical protein
MTALLAVGIVAGGVLVIAWVLSALGPEER